MTRLVLTLAIVLLCIAPVQALCVSRPDGAASHYVENNTAQALCLQRELAQQSAMQATQARIDATLNNLQLDLQRQQQLQHSMTFADPPGGL